MPGQHQVEDDQVGRRFPQPGQHIGSRREPIDAVSRLLQIVRDERGDIGVVFDDQDLGHEAMLNAE